MKRYHAAQWFWLLCVAVILVMECLPTGARMRFPILDETGNLQYRISGYAYFSLFPFAYGNFGPFLTAVFSCLTMIFLLIGLLAPKSRGVFVTARVFQYIALGTSFLPLLFGTAFYSRTALAISFALFVGCVLGIWLKVAMRKEKAIQKRSVIPTIFANMCMIYDGEGNVVIQQRSDTSWPGAVFPGGHVEDGESLVQSVIREVWEETGLQIQHPVLCGVKQFPTKECGRYLVFLFKANSFSGELRSSAEGEVRWVSRAELETLPLASGFAEMLPVFENDALSEMCWMALPDDEWTWSYY